MDTHPASPRRLLSLSLALYVALAAKAKTGGALDPMTRKGELYDLCILASKGTQRHRTNNQFQ